MREILFKAKQIDNGEWVEGHYISSCEGTFIQTNEITKTSEENKRRKNKR